MNRLIALVAAAFLAVGASHAATPALPDISGLAEASMNFDQEGVEPFLSGLAKTLPSGFGPAQAEQLSQAIDALPVDTKAGWEYAVTFQGRPTRLVVVASKDDVDAPDLYFYTSPELAAEIDRQLEAFAEAQGW